jgi:hypothetical protein
MATFILTTKEPHDQSKMFMHEFTVSSFDVIGVQAGAELEHFIKPFLHCTGTAMPTTNTIRLDLDLVFKPEEMPKARIILICLESYIRELIKRVY